VGVPMEYTLHLSMLVECVRGRVNGGVRVGGLRTHV